MYEVSSNMYVRGCGAAKAACDALLAARKFPVGAQATEVQTRLIKAYTLNYNQGITVTSHGIFLT